MFSQDAALSILYEKPSFDAIMFIANSTRKEIRTIFRKLKSFTILRFISNKLFVNNVKIELKFREHHEIGVIQCR